MIGIGKHWYVVQTHPHSEAKAVWHLNRQGFETYLPRYRRRRRHGRRVDCVHAPLFPRYLFVAVDMASQRWRSINSTIGVSRLVCNGENPAAVPDQVVDGLRVRENASGLIELGSKARFARGESVRIMEGAFAACLGLFEEVADGERVAVLLDMLGRKVRLVLDELSICAA